MADRRMIAGAKCLYQRRDVAHTGAMEPEATTLDPFAALADSAVALVESWVTQAAANERATERRATKRLAGVVVEPAGVAFAMRFVDRVIRPDDPSVGAQQLQALVAQTALPAFLSPLDRMLLRIGGRLAPRLPKVVMPLAIRRIRTLVGHLLVDANPANLAAHLATRRGEGYSTNVNLLGEAVLGKDEADRRHTEALDLLGHVDIDYVSVKVSSIVAQLNYWDEEGSTQRVIDRLRPLYERAAASSPPTFINLDMEEYHDLELTMRAFTTLLSEPELHGIDAGIVLQAYLPDSLDALKELVEWADRRRCRFGDSAGTVKIRLVKGANLAMERVDAALHGWEQAPYATKAEVDANYKRCIDWAFTDANLASVRIGIASHNLFDVALAYLLAEERNVVERVEFEMLEGMAPTYARTVRDAANGLLLYTPVVAAANFDVAISYLFRRLEENAADDNFIRHLFDLASDPSASDPSGSDPGASDPGAFAREAQKFRAAVASRNSVSVGSRRALPPSRVGEAGGFVNQPDTDPARAENRRWAARVLARPRQVPAVPLVTNSREIDDAVRAAQRAQGEWASRSPVARAEALAEAGDELARRRGDLIAAAVAEGNKTFVQADVEVSEAVDFARYYATRVAAVTSPFARFEPFGVVAVIPPWNFPIAIPAGGVLASLAAGNAAILKPAPQVPRCAEIITECVATATGRPALSPLLRTPDNELGRHLITHPAVDAVILTGAHETAELFRSWRPDLRIFAETSGKNAIVITPNADIDLAVSDLVQSAFGHSGQKCSAASLAICVGDVYESPRFRNQLSDAVSSLAVGPARDLATVMGPLIGAPEEKLLRALERLDPGESWLIEPRRLGASLWSPGVRLEVQPGSWFHHTECFGPVLGVMRARSLDEALQLQNATAFGLTGGIHSLDDGEIEHWLGRVEVGNAYVNRTTTGAIVGRQPFGGWKQSSIGPGAMAGGPNYVTQLGRWTPTVPCSLDEAAASDAAAWESEFALHHDPSDLFCEENSFRYRSLDTIVVRVEADALDDDVRRVLCAASRAGVTVKRSIAGEQTMAETMAQLHGEVRMRVVGTCSSELVAAANAIGVTVIEAAVTSDGRIELLHYLREQCVSRTKHRYGNTFDFT